MHRCIAAWVHDRVMSLRKYNPTTPGRRHSLVVSDLLSRVKPKRGLTTSLKSHAGRNNQGKITVRHRGAGVKRKLRSIDFVQDCFDIPGTVITIEYDPNRSSFIALVVYGNSEFRYILAPKGLNVGDSVLSSIHHIEARVGNRMPLEYIPAGFPIHSIEMEVGRGGKLVRSAGLSAQVLTVEGKYAQVKMPSGEVRMFPKGARASIGEVSNSDYRLARKGKAGTMRRLGVRPRVRGKAMNPVDHRHGGGEGRQPIGLPRPVTAWGKPALGVKTRNSNKWTNKLILKRRV